MGETFEPGCHGLKPVHLKSLEGLLFVCLAESPPDDFDDMARQMAPYVAPHRLRDTKVAFVSEIIEQGNWKPVIENNRECYHGAASRPELTVPLYAFGLGYAPGERAPDEAGQARLHNDKMAVSHKRWEACGLPSTSIEHLDDRVTGFRTMRLIQDGAGESHTMDTRVAFRKLLGDITDKAIGALHFRTQPNSSRHLLSDHIVTFSAIPLDEGRTLARTKWLVRKDAVEGVASAKAFGTRARLTDPAGIKARFPLIEERLAQGGPWDPDAGLVISAVADGRGQARRSGRAAGKPQTFADTQAKSLIIEGDRIRGVVTTPGAI